MSYADRVEPEEVRRKVMTGEALLVCAYDSDLRFRNARLSGAISLSEFISRLPALRKEQEIVFYCS